MIWHERDRAAQSPGSSPTGLECRDLTVRFGEHEVLRSVSIAVDAGGWAWIMGPSGGGKTTLLRAIAGLQQSGAGTVTMGGQSIHALPPHRRGVALLFQQPSLWPQLSALANVALALPGGSAARRAAALEWLERMGVAELAERFPGEMSGGQARRVELARALAGRPRLLLLDEPAAHLDLHLRGELLGALRAVATEHALTALCVTHDLEDGMTANERVILLEAGYKVFDGVAGNLSSARSSPYVEALVRRARRQGLIAASEVDP